VTVDRAAVPTKSEAAYTALREAILDGRLEPGSRVTLQALADDLGMSLTPVREALRLLGTHGLVEHDAHRGTRVASLSRRSVEEIFELRRVLEPLACKLAARHASQEQIAAIEEAAQALDAAVREKRVQDVPPLNAVLHRRMYEASGSELLLDFIDRLWGRIPYQAMSVLKHQDRSVAEHTAIVVALRERLPAEAARLMREHITMATRDTLEHVDQIQRADGDPRR
jgi:DNA-binding GntR family transcriptional regulator